MTLFVAMALTACGGAASSNADSSAPAGDSATSQPASSAESKPSSSKHTHTYDETKWESDETNHWHPATCEHTDSKGSKAAHTFVDDPTDPANKAATCSEPGVKVEKCSVCGYRKESPVLAEHDLQPIAHDKGEGEVTEEIKKCSKDAYYQISFSAADASDRKSDGYVKLSKQGDNASTIEWKIWSPVALKGRFWIDITGNTSNLWSRESKDGAQALYYTYNDTTTNINTWKNKVELNGVEVDFENAVYNVKGTDVKFGELVYSDFGELSSAGGATISVPMPEVNLNEGVNTLKFTRLTGYAFNMHNFTFKTSL